MKDITAEIMRTLFDYDHDTGIFWWRVKPSRRVKAGAAAGSVSSDGYIVIGVDGTNFKAHRLAWLHFHGVWPSPDQTHTVTSQQTSSTRGSYAIRGALATGSDSSLSRSKVSGRRVLII